MVQLEEARKAPPAFAEASAGRRLVLPGKAGAGGARSGLESLAGFDQPRMDTDQHGYRGAEIGNMAGLKIRDGECQTQNRIADRYSVVNYNVSIRNDLHSSNVEAGGRRRGEKPHPCAARKDGPPVPGLGRPALSGWNRLRLGGSMYCPLNGELWACLACVICAGSVSLLRFRSAHESRSKQRRTNPSVGDQNYGKHSERI